MLGDAPPHRNPKLAVTGAPRECEGVCSDAPGRGEMGSGGRQLSSGGRWQLSGSLRSHGNGAVALVGGGGDGPPVCKAV